MNPKTQSLPSGRLPQKRRKQKKRGRKWTAVLFWIIVLAVLGYGLFRQIDGAKPDFRQMATAGNTGGTSSDEGVSAVFGESAKDKTAWNLILVNREHPIPGGYDVELTKLSNGQSVDARIYPALQQMFDDARADGIYPIVVSGYRTEKEQKQLMREKIADYEEEGYSPDEAKAKAQEWVAVPGTSEHQLGLCADINADGIHSAGNEVYEWLEKNAHRYGFIKRYPADKSEITGTIHEPWHYRYVGAEAAAEIYRQGLCLEEYIETLE